MSRGRRLPPAPAAVAALAVVGVLLVGCSTVPSSSPTVQITQAAAPSTDAVGIEPLPPEAGETPEEVVRGFIDAAASTTRGHPVAREHLAPNPAQTWADGDGITVISPDYAAVTTDAGTVQVTAKLVGTVDSRGLFTPGGGQVYLRDFSLQQVKGQWRISDPPDGLLISEPDFQRLYDRRDLYFPDPTGQRVVADPRYLITGQAQPTTLVERLLDGPSTELSPAVKNPLAGVQLRRAVSLSGSTATVDLTGVGNQPVPVLSQLCAQLVWTLAQVGVTGVQVLVDGEPIDLDGVPEVQTTSDWSGFDPDAAAGSIGHYVDAGALRTVDGKPAPGPAGTGSYGIQAAAVSADARTGGPADTAAVAGAPGAMTLLVGGYGKDLVPVLSAPTITAPTVSATRDEFWVVHDGTQVTRVPQGAAAQPVDAPTLPSLGTVAQLRLSPDGVRAAVVVDGPGGPALYVGVVVRRSDGGVSLQGLTPITPSLTQVVDAAWRSSDTLLVLAGEQTEGSLTPYTVGVDGSELTAVSTSGLPSAPTAIGVSPGRQPLVCAGNSIWEESGGTWVTLLRGQEPLPGTAPFYPV